ncbi:hypothetical protein N7510_005722 [Penicillium lagena]|uniref:uncharacterized protein n=1 Tax=Penicillium lagena TaxID=94218 RepID=UPI002541BFA2|nr:uncharacterized protein N7510_005722 [Penicillium lagena]KAJ5612528.1 hypothetical protein N7510_005722 [Penicillium lagena]
MSPNIPYLTHLALAKFSHTTTPIEHAGPLTWHHVNGNGELLCIFEKLPDSVSMPTRLILRVVQHQTTLV